MSSTVLAGSNTSTVNTSWAESLAIGLACFSLALGAAELVMPRTMTRLIGASGHDQGARRLRGFGKREIASGLAILAQPQHPRWLWSRVGGDVADLWFLRRALRAGGAADRRRALVATAAVLGVTLLDVVAALRLIRLNRERSH